MSLEKFLKARVSGTLRQKWKIRVGRTIPQTQHIVLSGGGVRLDATVLYADLKQSSKLATEFQNRTASKIIKSFLFCSAKLIRLNRGRITSFDGDRVMGIFIGKNKDNCAVKSALNINYVVRNIIKPLVTEYFTSVEEEEFEISHCVGVDTSNFLSVRAGMRDSNDLIWIGRAPNLAAKLSEIRGGDFNSYISEEVYSNLDSSMKVGGSPAQLIWQRGRYSFLDNYITVYCSSQHISL